MGFRYDKNGAVKIDEESGRLVGYCRHHDIEEFEEVLNIYGVWHGELRKFLDGYKKKEEE